MEAVFHCQYFHSSSVIILCWLTVQVGLYRSTCRWKLWPCVVKALPQISSALLMNKRQAWSAMSIVCGRFIVLAIEMSRDCDSSRESLLHQVYGACLCLAVTPYNIKSIQLHQISRPWHRRSLTAIVSPTSEAITVHWLSDNVLQLGCRSTIACGNGLIFQKSTLPPSLWPFTA